MVLPMAMADTNHMDGIKIPFLESRVGIQALHIKKNKVSNVWNKQSGLRRMVSAVELNDRGR